MIELQRVAISSGAFRLENISFAAAQGEHVVLMGKTGSGKTTILEAICGLRPVTSGSIWIDGRDATRLHPAERNVGYVPQDLALFPTFTVAEQLGFALQVRRFAKSQIDQRVEELAALLGITSLLKRLPTSLSGGEKQRVAIGRALSFRAPVLLLDEPLSALDDDTREEIRALLRHIQKNANVTTLHVTHHRGDAQALANRRWVVEKGRVVEESSSQAIQP